MKRMLQALAMVGMIVLCGSTHASDSKRRESAIRSRVEGILTSQRYMELFDLLDDYGLNVNARDLTDAQLGTITAMISSLMDFSRINEHSPAFAQIVLYRLANINSANAQAAVLQLQQQLDPLYGVPAPYHGQAFLVAKGSKIGNALNALLTSINGDLRLFTRLLDEFGFTVDQLPFNDDKRAVANVLFDFYIRNNNSINNAFIERLLERLALDPDQAANIAGKRKQLADREAKRRAAPQAVAVPVQPAPRAVAIPAAAVAAQDVPAQGAIANRGQQVRRVSAARRVQARRTVPLRRGKVSARRTSVRRGRPQARTQRGRATQSWRARGARRQQRRTSPARRRVYSKRVVKPTIVRN